MSTLPDWKPNAGRARRPLARFGSRGPGSFYRRLKSLQLLATRDARAVRSFLRARFPIALPWTERLAILARFVRTTNAIRCYHTQAELLAVSEAILERAGPHLTVVEAGAAKGASSAKLSWVTGRAGGRLHIFDSFRGLPLNEERHQRLDGSEVVFFKGAFSGRVPTVQKNLARFGRPEVCTLHKGWFEETMPGFEQAIDVALLDVDLLSSTETCLKYLMPRLKPGGVLFTQDGHLKAIADRIADERFWREEVGIEPPIVEGLYERKMVILRSASRVEPLGWMRAGALPPFFEEKVDVRANVPAPVSRK